MSKSLVWDIPTRLCHWVLVGGIAYAWYAVEVLEDLEQHFIAGYVVLSALLFRLVWGFVGTHHARFKQFFFSPNDVFIYVRSLFTRAGPHYLGHNPLGSLSALAMLIAIAVQTGTGLFSSDDYFFGPLSGLIPEGSIATFTNIHHLNFDVLTVLIVVHLMAILFYLIYKKENLTTAMITGRKDPATGQVVISGSKLILAGVVLVGCIAAVVVIANAFVDTLPSGDAFYY